MVVQVVRVKQLMAEDQVVVEVVIENHLVLLPVVILLVYLQIVVLQLYLFQHKVIQLQLELVVDQDLVVVNLAEYQLFQQ